MKKFTLKHVLIAYFIGVLTAGTSAAIAAKMVGGNGSLMGWEVTINGKSICDDPYIWSSTHEIECD